MTADALQVLEDVHRELLHLFDRVRSPDEDRPAVLKTIMETWSGHTAVEQQILVPLLHNHVEGGAALAAALEADHHAVERILTRLERRKANSPDVVDLATELLDLTERHVTQANDGVLPALRQSLTGDQLAHLGTELVEDRAVGQHRHDAKPDTGPIAQVLRKASGMIDHLRDHVDDVTSPAHDAAP
jgi:hemerythrin-like domain-containing protein